MRKILLFCFCLGFHSMMAQQIVLKGKVGGDIRAKVALLTLYGDTLATTDMDRGAFELTYKGVASMYKVAIGGWAENYYLPQDTIRISGYVDRSGNENDVKLKGIDAHQRVMQAKEIANKAKREYDKWLDDSIKNFPEPQKTELLITLYKGRSDKASDALREWVKGEADPSVAAAGTFVGAGDMLYEEMKAVADALPQEAWQTGMGTLFADMVKNASLTANGVVAPDFTVKDAQDNDIQLSSLRGNIVLIDFWASWCGPCRQEMVYLKQLYSELKDKNVRFISVSMDDNRAQWEKAAQEEQIPWLSGLDPQGFTNSKLRQLYNFQQIPFCLVLDDQGRVIGKNLRRTQLKEAILSKMK